MKTKEIGYEDIFLKNFNQLKDMLKLILINNPNSRKFEFYGVLKNGKRGILVCGKDTMDIRDFTNFFSVQEIYYYYNNLNKRLQRR